MWQRTLWLKNFARHHRRARSDTGYILRLVAILTPMEVWICSARSFRKWLNSSPPDRHTSVWCNSPTRES
jgi:hypothetical protein